VVEQHAAPDPTALHLRRSLCEVCEEAEHLRSPRALAVSCAGAWKLSLSTIIV
jgi:hypothetical protein